MDHPSKERERWFAKFRAEWFHALRPMGSWVPWELREHVQLEERYEEAEEPLWEQGLLTRAPQLGDEHVRRCTLVPDRLALLARLPKGGVVAEVGTLQGEFARDILRVTEPKELHLIDHEVHPHVVTLTEDPALRNRVHFHHQDSAEALLTFPDRYFDWIYIDAQHAYDGVKRDIDVARRKVKDGGLLVFNDYIVWSYVEMEPYGVVAAVNELCIEDKWEMIYLALPSHMYCDVALKKIR